MVGYVGTTETSVVLLDGTGTGTTTHVYPVWVCCATQGGFATPFGQVLRGRKVKNPPTLGRWVLARQVRTRLLCLAQTKTQGNPTRKSGTATVPTKRGTPKPDAVTAGQQRTAPPHSRCTAVEPRATRFGSLQRPCIGTRYAGRIIPGRISDVTTWLRMDDTATVWISPSTHRFACGGDFSAQTFTKWIRG